MTRILYRELHRSTKKAYNLTSVFQAMLPKRANLVALSTPDRFPLLKCPRCNGLLKSAVSQVACSDCPYRMPFVDGILSATIDPDYYDHQLPESQLDAYLAQAGKLGWTRALYQLQRSRPQDREQFFSQVADVSRAGWKFLLPLSGASKVLVLGVGVEAIPISFASSSGVVIAVDACRKRLESLRHHVRARRVESIYLIHGSDLEQLPFYEGYFDLVVIADLQDWLPQLSGTNGRQIPLSFLRTLKRLMTPQGTLYVAGENRFTYSGIFQSHRAGPSVWEVTPNRHGFMGSATGRAESNDAESNDPGPKQADTRNLPGARVGAKRGRRSSTSSHSYRGYQRRLVEAGMHPMAVYAPVPDHRNPSEVVDLSASGQSVGAAMVNASAPVLGISSILKSRIRSNPHFLRAFGHSYALVSAPREVGVPSFLARVFSELERSLQADHLQLDQYSIGQSEVTIDCSVVAAGIDQHLAIRLPLGRAEAQGVLRNARALVRLRELPLEAALQNTIPHLLYSGEVQGQRVIVESRERGETLEDVFGQWSRDRICLAVEEVVSLISRKYAPRPVAWHQSGQKRFQQMCHETSNNLIDPSVRAWFARLVGRLLDRLAVLTLPTVLTHGDLRLRSVVLHPDRGALAQINNWSAMTEFGLPGWDLISLESSMVQQSRQCSLGESVVWLWQNGHAQGFQTVWKAYERNYGGRHGVGAQEGGFAGGFSDSFRRSLLLSYWVRALWQKFRQPLAPLNYEWVRANVIGVLEQIDRAS